MKDERTEDLNPGSEDIEEKIRRMLDPSIPDEPETPDTPRPAADKTPVIQAVSTSLPDEPDDQAPSAPELPSSDTKKSKSKKSASSKKVIIPIKHHDEVEAVEDPEIAASEELSKKQVKQITIADHNESPDDLEKQLNKTLAELDEAHKEPEQTPSDEPQPAEAVDTTDDAEAEDLEPIELPAEAEQPEEIEPIEPAKPERPLPKPIVVEDTETDKAVDAIVAAEGDELLEIEDAVRDTEEPVNKPQKAKSQSKKRLGTFLKSPALRWTFGILVLASLTVAAVIPRTRYQLLNIAGVRGSSSLQVLDQSTQQPLKNVHVTLGDASGTTDESGKVTLQKIKLGSALLTIEKRAFAPVTKPVVVGWGSNPLGDFSLNPTGTQYGFVVKDYLSGNPISKVEATSGDASAVSDDKGVIKLTIDKPGDKNFTVTLSGTDYRPENIELDPNDKTDHELRLVPARKHVFVSKRSGNFDIYSVYIDGKDEKLVLAATGKERDDMVLVPHPTANVVAYVSTRGDQHDNDGFLMSNLMLINLDDDTTKNIVTANRVQVIDWSGQHLVYVQIIAGESADSPKRYRLMSYNYQDGSNKELASSNYFNDVIAANGAIYYAPSTAYQSSPTGLFKINPDGSGSQTLFNQEVWNIFRTSYDHFALSVQQQWYDYRLGDKAPTKLNSSPANQTQRIYITSPDAAHSLWIDNRDGKGTLVSYDTATKNEITLAAASGLTYPVHWLNNDSIVYRVKSDQETADYAVSLDGGTPVKITDVTNSGGIDRWYYY